MNEKYPYFDANNWVSYKEYLLDSWDEDGLYGFAARVHLDEGSTAPSTVKVGYSMDHHVMQKQRTAVNPDRSRQQTREVMDVSVK